MQRNGYGYPIPAMPTAEEKEQAIRTMLAHDPRLQQEVRDRLKQGSDAPGGTLPPQPPESPLGAATSSEDGAASRNESASRGPSPELELERMGGRTSEAGSPVRSTIPSEPWQRSEQPDAIVLYDEEPDANGAFLTVTVLKPRVWKPDCNKPADIIPQVLVFPDLHQADFLTPPRARKLSAMLEAAAREAEALSAGLAPELDVLLPSVRRSLLAESQPALSARKLNVLRHALGADSPHPGFRNHFVAGDDHADWETLQACVSDGLMVQRGRSEILGGMTVFHVTKAGQEACGVRYVG